MDTTRLGEELLALCWSEGNRFAEVNGLLESLSEDRSREVVRYKNEVN